MILEKNPLILPQRLTSNKVLKTNAMMTTKAASRKEGAGNNYIVSISIIGLFFFIFGFVTWLNGILIPYLKIACELTDFQALFVAFAFYISYTLMALPSSRLLKKTGFKSGMMVG